MQVQKTSQLPGKISTTIGWYGKIASNILVFAWLGELYEVTFSGYK